MTLSLPRTKVLGPVILAALLILAAILTAIATRHESSLKQPLSYPTYDVHESGPQGTRALALWLSDLGYQPSTLQYRPFKLSSADGLLLMLFPSLDPSAQQIQAIVSWVEQGGTLVVASGKPSNLLSQLGVQVIPHAAQMVDVRPAQPMLLNPPVGRSAVNTYATLAFRDPAWIPLLEAANNDEIVAASITKGDGTIIVLSSGDPFSNSGLSEPGNRDLVLNLLASVPAGSTTIIDEYHHGFTEQGTFTYQLFRQPWGWSILYLVTVLFVFLVLSGRRFGHVARPYSFAQRRARSEFAITLASMLHQNRHREWLRDHYLEQLKRMLGKRFRVQSTLPTPIFLEQIAQRSPNAIELVEPLREIESDKVPEEQRLVALIREIELIAARLMQRPTANIGGQTASRSDNPIHDEGKTGI